MARKQLDEAFVNTLREPLDSWRRGDINLEDATEILNTSKRSVPDAERFSYLGQIESWLGIVCGYAGRLDQAARHFEAAALNFRRNQDDGRLLGCELNLGETYRLMGNFPQAARAFRLSYELARKEGMINSQSLALANEAIVFVEMGNYKQARSNIQRAVELADQPWATPEADPLRRLSSKCEMHYTYGLLEIREGNLDAAWAQAKESLRLAEQVNEPYRFGQAYAIIAQVIDACGKSPEDGYQDQPDSYFQQAIDYFAKIKSERELANVYLIYGRSLAQREKENEAREAYTQAIAIFARLGLPKLTAQAAEARAVLGRR